MNRPSYLNSSVVLLALMIIPGFILPDWMRYVFTVALCKAFVVLGVVILLRAGLVSFGHALFFAAAAYSVAFSANLWGIREALVLIILGVLASLALAAIIGLLVARYREIFFAMITLAFSMAFFGMLVKAYRFTGGTDGLRIPTPAVLGFHLLPQTSSIAIYFLVLFCLVIVVYLINRFMNSPYGYILRAIKENEIRVSYMGGSVPKAVYLTFLLSGGLAGLGGSLITFNVGHIDPYLSYWTTSGEFVFVALLSGTGNVFACIGGSIFIEFIKTYAFKYTPYTWQMMLGGIMLVVILFSPGGLWALYENLVQRTKMGGKKYDATT
ncbi:MAG: branched-chain amino acid ABC transporter permease [Bacillota bacterium]